MIKRIAIMGCGSLGTILGAYLNKAGLDVMMVDAWKEHVDVLNREGATVTGGVQMNVPVKACTPDPVSYTHLSRSNAVFQINIRCCNKSALQCSLLR